MHQINERKNKKSLIATQLVTKTHLYIEATNKAEKGGSDIRENKKLADECDELIESLVLISVLAENLAKKIIKLKEKHCKAEGDRYGKTR